MGRECGRSMVRRFGTRSAECVDQVEIAGSQLVKNMPIGIAASKRALWRTSRVWPVNRPMRESSPDGWSFVCSGRVMGKLAL